MGRTRGRSAAREVREIQTREKSKGIGGAAAVANEPKQERAGVGVFRFVQICSDLFRFVQICSDLFRFVQICSDFVQTAGRTENQGARGVAGGEAGGVGVANEPKQEEGVGGVKK